MHALFSISLGAALGASLRWAIGLGLNGLFESLAFGTFIANALGCLLMGVAIGVLLDFPFISQAWRLFFITGFLGSLTTFSAFSAEIVENFLQAKWLAGFGIMSLHIFLGLACTGLGLWLWKVGS